MKRLILIFVILDNLLTNLTKKLFPRKWTLTGACRQCGNCCKEIYLKMTPGQMKSRLFTNISIRWISWLFDFNLLRTDHEHHYLVFNCKHLTSDGKCGNYFWRPNICRNYPLVDYFEEPKLLPGCGFKAIAR
jgi:hypothetical protein